MKYKLGSTWICRKKIYGPAPPCPRKNKVQTNPSLQKKKLSLSLQIKTKPRLGLMKENFSEPGFEANLSPCRPLMSSINFDPYLGGGDQTLPAPAVLQILLLSCMRTDLNWPAGPNSSPGLFHLTRDMTGPDFDFFSGDLRKAITSQRSQRGFWKFLVGLMVIAFNMFYNKGSN